MVLASKPVASVIRLAARPVGAHSKSSVPFATRMRRMALTMVKSARLKRARIEHVNFQAGILHIPKPKGGEVKAFDIPLSRAMIRCLVRVMQLGRVLYPTQAQEWLFPAESDSGHLAEHKEDRATISKWGNDLRQTYRTVAQTTGIADLDIHLLMIYAVPGVNAGYINRSKLLSNHLRQQQEMISRKIVGALQERFTEDRKRSSDLAARSCTNGVGRSTAGGGDWDENWPRDYRGFGGVAMGVDDGDGIEARA